MTHRVFVGRLNHELDTIEVPEREDERVEAFAKMFHLPKFKAEAILRGITLPDEELLQTIANEFEIKPDWLAGRED